MNSSSRIINSVRLFRTSPHSCSYKEDRQAATVFVDPDLRIDRSLNSKLTELGYRRSGAHLYRPDCDFCSACVSCRLPVELFRRRRRHQKVWNRNRDLTVTRTDTLDCEQSYRLYRNYINSRHRNGDMYPATPEQFDAFIKTATDDTWYYKFYLGKQLVAVSVTDILEQGLSAVYTFFEPSLPNRSLGSYVILWQIQKAVGLEMPYLFLGYWIKGCAKMQYKSEYRPIELLIDGRWVLLN